MFLSINVWPLALLNIFGADSNGNLPRVDLAYRFNLRHLLTRSPKSSLDQGSWVFHCTVLPMEYTAVLGRQP